MMPYIFFIFLFHVLALAAPFMKSRENYNGDGKAVAFADSPVPEILNQNQNATLLLLWKRDEIDDWNRDNPDNRIAAFYVCPHQRSLFTVFNAMAVYQAFRRGTWYLAHPNEARPRWSGLEHPHSMLQLQTLQDYHAHRVDLGRASGELFMFPINPNPPRRVARDSRIARLRAPRGPPRGVRRARDVCRGGRAVYGRAAGCCY
ncbi:hypothetical protein Daesc_010259 [Daldinia eschscholtzii]|uniref:Uncharacterized protein n=1 Tax=Daldinia eschscholtzii TaxID=292717 RepID=A0AAX6M8H0_9PEZI